MDWRRIGLGLTCGALMLAAPMGAAVASGGGGSGMGAMPSASVPEYDAVAEYQAGMAAYQAGKFKDAIENFEHVTDAQPRDANNWYMLGMARSGAGDAKGAVKALQKSIKIDPAPVAPHRELAIALATMKDDPKAQAELGVLQTRSAACADACPEAADLKAAIAAVNQALGVVPPNASTTPLPDGVKFAGLAGGDMAYVRAVSLINERRYADALAALDAAQAAFGPHPDVLTYKGYVWRKLGDLNRAEGFYRAALSVAPGHRGATEYYGELKVIRGDLAGARVMLARLDAQCGFGCAEAEDLRRWIARGGDPAS